MLSILTQPLRWILYALLGVVLLLALRTQYSGIKSLLWPSVVSSPVTFLSGAYETEDRNVQAQWLDSKGVMELRGACPGPGPGRVTLRFSILPATISANPKGLRLRLKSRGTDRSLVFQAPGEEAVVLEMENSPWFLEFEVSGNASVAPNDSRRLFLFYLGALLSC